VHRHINIVIVRSMLFTSLLSSNFDSYDDHLFVKLMSLQFTGVIP